VVDYVHDLENRWIGKLIDSDGDGTVDQRTAFAYDGNQIVLQFEDDDLSHRYLWQPDAVDQLMADEQIEMDDVVWALTDQLGTVRDFAVTDAETGETSVVNHIAYDSFGNKANETNAAVDCLFGFTGRPLDEVTGLQNNLNRWYDASTGRWMSKDPVGFEGKDANAYRYVGNSPTRSSDPSGLFMGLEGMGGYIKKWQREAADKEFAANLENLKNELLACCSSLSAPEKAKCESEIEAIVAGVQKAYTNLWDRGGPKLFSYFGPVCVDCQREVMDCVPGGTYFNIKAVGRYGPNLLGFDRSVPGTDHVWCEIIYKPTDRVFTIDFWAGGTAFWRSGSDSFRWKQNSCPPLPPRVPYIPPRIPGGWSVCFREGTQVHTESGLQGIETVSIGTKVWSYNHASETWNLMPVVDTEAHDFAGAMVTLRVGKDTIEATTTHPFWVVSGESLETRPSARTREGANHSSTGSGQWVAASDLQCGDVLLTRDGRLLAVGSTETAETKVRIHNLLVDRLNNYAVGNAGLLVNNM